MQSLGRWLSAGIDSVRLTVVLDDLEGLLQPKLFCDHVPFCVVCCGYVFGLRSQSFPVFPPNQVDTWVCFHLTELHEQNTSTWDSVSLPHTFS